MARYHITQKLVVQKVETFYIVFIFVSLHFVSQQLQVQIFRPTPEQQQIFRVPQCRFSMTTADTKTSVSQLPVPSSTAMPLPSSSGRTFKNVIAQREVNTRPV